MMNWKIMSSIWNMYICIYVFLYFCISVEVLWAQYNTLVSSELGLKGIHSSRIFLSHFLYICILFLGLIDKGLLIDNKQFLECSPSAQGEKKKEKGSGVSSHEALL